MNEKLNKYYNRLREQLWFRPLLFCLLSIGGALVAHLADGIGINEKVPNIDKESIEDLLSTLSSSMLVIAIFAVASMLSAFSSASSTATPRSFKIVITDDVSQNALSVFIGAFIFSLVGTIALGNGYYGEAGRFILFVFTLITLAIVVLTFLRWVDRISRLGRLEHTITQVENVVATALTAYIKNPNLKSIPPQEKLDNEHAVHANEIGYIQHIYLEPLQKLAEEKGLKIQLNCVPGKFVNKNFVVAHFSSNANTDMQEIQGEIHKNIRIGPLRLFDEDPRFGFIALTEIASRALSPGINDPGTAIQIIGTHERLFFLWNEPRENKTEEVEFFDRVAASSIAIEDFFDDAFRPISRDGAGNIEVMLRLQKALSAIATINNVEIKQAALDYSEKAYNRAELAMDSKDDLELLKSHSLFSQTH